jgi:hypothetical protein
MMKQSTFNLNYQDESLLALVKGSDHRTLALWAIDCVERVLPYFKEALPDDPRPQRALETLQNWIETGAFSMAVIRGAALDAHAAAREVGADTPARSAARAAGQALATAHVPAHAIAAANYALQATHRANIHANPDAVVTKERAWQYQHLVDLQGKS